MTTPIPGTTPTPDDVPARWPLLLVVFLLLPAALLAALVISSSSTLLLFGAHGVAEAVRPFAVGLLEIVSTAGTLLAIFAAGPRLRRRALVAVAVASGVSAVGGWSAYGWLGLVAPCAVVGLVHLSAEAWAELRRSSRALAQVPTAPTTTADQPLTSDDVPDGGTNKPVLEGPVDEPDQRSSAPTGPVHGPLTLVETVREHLAEDPSISERALRDELEVTRHAVRRALIEARSGLAEVSA